MPLVFGGRRAVIAWMGRKGGGEMGGQAGGEQTNKQRSARLCSALLGRHSARPATPRVPRGARGPLIKDIHQIMFTLPNLSLKEIVRVCYLVVLYYQWNLEVWLSKELFLFYLS